MGNDNRKRTVIDLQSQPGGRNSESIARYDDQSATVDHTKEAGKDYGDEDVASGIPNNYLIEVNEADQALPRQQISNVKIHLMTP